MGMSSGGRELVGGKVRRASLAAQRELGEANLMSSLWESVMVAAAISTARQRRDGLGHESPWAVSVSVVGSGGRAD